MRLRVHYCVGHVSRSHRGNNLSEAASASHKHQADVQNRLSRQMSTKTCAGLTLLQTQAQRPKSSSKAQRARAMTHTTTKTICQQMHQLQGLQQARHLGPAIQQIHDARSTTLLALPCDMMQSALRSLRVLRHHRSMHRHLAAKRQEVSYLTKWRTCQVLALQIRTPAESPALAMMWQRCRSSACQVLRRRRPRRRGLTARSSLLHQQRHLQMRSTAFQTAASVTKVCLIALTRLAAVWTGCRATGSASGGRAASGAASAATAAAIGSGAAAGVASGARLPAARGASACRGV